MPSLSTSPFTQFASDVRQEIEDALEASLIDQEGCPALLADAMRYSVLGTGKRLRPLLVLIAAEACGSDRVMAMPAACAVEMIHAYSLIHDDLPAMDDDDTRRGRPSCHICFGEATAILTGDALQARAFELLARDLRPPALAARCCLELATAVGAAALVGGQVDDLSAEGLADGLAEDGHRSTSDIRRLLDLLRSIHARKTGALIRVSLRLGALAALADDEAVARMDRFGQHVGAAFQIVDDLLDHDGDPADLGKRTQKDAERGKLTYPGLLGVEESRRQAEELTRQACDEAAALGVAGERLAALARFVLERRR